MNELNVIRTCDIEPKCDHVMDEYEPIFDDEGRKCGEH